MRQPRFELTAPIDWCVEGTLTRFRSTTRDVSDGGVLISTHAVVGVGAPIDLYLGLPRVRLRGRVARTGHAGVAIRFEEHAPDVSPVRVAAFRAM